MKISVILYIILAVSLAVIFYNNYNIIPSKIDHINRNKYNIHPVGRLR